MSFRIAALVLAAGRSSRMGSNKLLEAVGGQPMIRHAVAAAMAVADPVLVVTGNEGAKVRAALADIADVRFVENPDYSNGLSTSLICGINALPGDCDGVLMLLGDMPGVDAALLERLVAAFDPAAGRAIIAPVHDGKRGNPVLWGKEHFDALRGLTGDTGARALLATNPVFTVPGGAGALADLDTPEALAAWRAPSSQSEKS